MSPGAAPPLLNRELSWLEFNARVLYLAEDRRNPLLERVKFLAIFASNLDEFFQVRVSGLKQQRATITAGSAPAETLAAVRARVLELTARHGRVYAALCDELAAAGVRIVSYASIPEHHRRLRERFVEEIFPVLTPLALDPGHPFPFVSTLSLSVAVVMREPESGVDRFARVKVPPVLPRFVDVGGGALLPLEDVIRANLDLLFAGMDIAAAYLFRVTRDADLDLAEDEADDLLRLVEEELRRRRFGQAVRVEVERSMPEAVRQIVRHGVGVGEEDCYEVDGLFDLTALMALLDLPRPELKVPPWTPVVPPRLASIDEEPPDLFEVIRQGDLLVHHPYESFAASVERFVSQAAADPDVLTIKQTLYRVGGDSPIVRSLIRAAESGKQVAVMVEIRARADEEGNIVWARRLERAGAHVTYGLLGLKTHCKIALVVRREDSLLRRYVHVGTGNYNPKTARQYTDLGLFTCRPEVGADATDLFNTLTGLSRQREFRKFLVAPHGLRRRLIELLEREAEHARAGRGGRAVFKVNHLVDPASIEALYRASQAGVRIDLIVRTMCALVPGVEGVSENVRVRSVVGEFLEHSRVFGFGNGGQTEWYFGSADLMERNLERRIEVVVPVEEPTARARVEEVVDLLLADDRNAWELGADGSWRRAGADVGADARTSVFEALKERAQAGASRP
jgi:polyphosphate kinase